VGNKLLPKYVIEKLPPIYSQENAEDPICVVKFFDILSSWAWYGIEYDPETELFFGFVHGYEDELGYFSFPELRDFGIRIERDLWFKPTPLSEVKALYKNEWEA